MPTFPGGKRDLRKAVSLYRRAAAQGNRNACYNLGLYYDIGRGVPENRRLSFRWHLKAWQLGDHESQRIVGYRYHEGKGVRRDPERAIFWYRRAARGGDVYAEYNLAPSTSMEMECRKNDLRL